MYWNSNHDTFISVCSLLTKLSAKGLSCVERNDWAMYQKDWEDPRTQNFVHKRMAYGQQAILSGWRRQPSNRVGRQTRVIQLDGSIKTYSSFNLWHSALHSTYCLQKRQQTHYINWCTYNSFKISFRIFKESHPRCACKTYICWK